jgi:hypothetical protein
VHLLLATTVGGALLIGACSTDAGDSSNATGSAAPEGEGAGLSGDTGPSPSQPASSDAAPTGPTSADASAADAAPALVDAGASPSDAEAGALTPDAEAGAPPPPPPPPPDIYDPTTIPKFELTFDAATMAVLMNLTEETKDTWVHGAFKYGGIVFADVGVRTKGSTTFRVLPQKASLKVKFNKWVKGQKLHGLEEITLNNMVADRTALNQRLSYHVFRALGLPASRANTSQVTINGADYGIYANVETPDENFLERVFGATAGSLYEVHGGGQWLPGSDARWETDIELPGAPANTRPDLALLFQAVAAANDATLLADLGGRLHTTKWLRYCAAEAVTGHHDGYAYGKYTHNYFMAGDTTGKFALVPWSTDGTLSDNQGVPNASMPHPDVVLTRCSKSTVCWNAYKAEVQSVLTSYEALDLVTLATTWHNQIDALERADPKREHTISTYEKQTTALYTWLATRPSIVRTQLGL